MTRHDTQYVTDMATNRVTQIKQIAACSGGGAVTIACDDHDEIQHMHVCVASRLSISKVSRTWV